MESLLQSSGESLRRVFLQSFSVMDLAEPLISFDTHSDGAFVRQFMDERRLQVIGTRSDGLVTGVIDLEDVTENGPIGPGRTTADMPLLESTASLVETVESLRSQQRRLISILGYPGAIVSRTDIEKPAARMWLFGMVTLIEMRYSRVVQQFCPEDSWKQYLSESRVTLAEGLMQERLRRHQDVDLISCLQFSDKMQIVARNAEIREKTQFESRRQVEQVAKLLQKLRNNLAHSQSIVTDDWDTILLLTEHIDIILSEPHWLSR